MHPNNTDYVCKSLAWYEFFHKAIEMRALFWKLGIGFD